MFKKVFGLFRTIRPKSKPPGYFDYLQVDHDNPNRPVDDYYIMHKSQPVISSLELGLVLYSLVAVAVFVVTRIRHDRDWDRFYHVNYPGLMEHFDRIFDHYSNKAEETLDNLPASLQEIFDELLKPLQVRMPSKMQIVDDPKISAKLAETFANNVGIQEDPIRDIKKNLAESDLD